jgi:hypothetical protein
VLTLVWQIISWGAGFDTSFFRLATNGSVHPEVYFFEVDFAEVVDRKAECILGSKSLQDCIGSFEGKIQSSSEEGPEGSEDSLSSNQHLYLAPPESVTLLLPVRNTKAAVWRWLQRQTHSTFTIKQAQV